MAQLSYDHLLSLRFKEQLLLNFLHRINVLNKYDYGGTDRALVCSNF